MTDHDHEFERALEHRVLRLFDRLEVLVDVVIERLLRVSPPAAGTLSAIFTLSGDSDMTTAVLVATIPTLRQDGTVLAATDIASITFQKTSLTGTPPVAGPQLSLAVNSASPPGSGLTPAQITFSDVSSLDGDSYTFFVTDSAGNIGALSNAVVNGIAPVLSAPAAGTLTATFQ